MKQFITLNITTIDLLTFINAIVLFLIKQGSILVVLVLLF